MEKKSKHSGHVHIINKAHKAFIKRAAIFSKAYRLRSKPYRAVNEPYRFQNAFRTKPCKWCSSMFQDLYIGWVITPSLHPPPKKKKIRNDDIIVE